MSKFVFFVFEFFKDRSGIEIFLFFFLFLKLWYFLKMNKSSFDLEKVS